MTCSHRARTAGIVFCIMSVLAISFLWNPAAFADRPNFLKQMFQRRDAGNQDMQLQDKHGPWLILAATFSGERARDNAVAYATELKQRLKTPAFIMQQSDSSNNLYGLGERIVTDEFGRQIPKKISARYANNADEQSIAVLVGEFHSKEDPQVDVLLQKVRSFEPKAKNGDLQGMDKTTFLTRNPLLPEDFFQTPQVDEFVQELNRQEWIQHGLLDCPGRFTVRVATFRGPDVISVTNKARLDAENPTTALDRAASKANKMTMSLRSRGVEAYEFHDRYGSYVMIGSFDALGSESESGQFQYDPRILTILQQFCGYREVTAKDPETGATSRTWSLNSENRIPFDIEGKPIAVPRRSTTQIYGGSLFK